MGRSTGVGPGIIALDSSVIKNFQLTERQSLQFRFEAFNLPNHANFGLPDSILTSSTFGQINSTRTSMRSLQFGLKYNF
jgi:hypothetical protein